MGYFLRRSKEEIPVVTFPLPPQCTAASCLQSRWTLSITYHPSRPLVCHYFCADIRASWNLRLTKNKRASGGTSQSCERKNPLQTWTSWQAAEDSTEWERHDWQKDGKERQRERLFPVSLKGDLQDRACGVRSFFALGDYTPFYHCRISKGDRRK